MDLGCTHGLRDAYTGSGRHVEALGCISGLWDAYVGSGMHIPLWDACLGSCLKTSTAASLLAKAVVGFRV